MAKFVKLIVLLTAVALLAGVPAGVSGQQTATVGFTQTAFTAYEYQTIQFTVELRGSFSSEMTVDVSTRDGEAQAGSDYTSLDTTVTFPPNTSSQTITVSLLDDSQVEAFEESFSLELSSPSTGITLSPTAATATVTIQDDDEATIGFPSDFEVVGGDSGTFELEVLVEEPGIGCPIAVPFTLSISYDDPDGGLSSPPPSPLSMEFDACATMQEVEFGIIDILTDADDVSVVYFELVEVLSGPEDVNGNSRLRLDNGFTNNIFELEIQSSLPLKLCSITFGDPKTNAVNFLRGSLNGQRLGCANPSVTVTPGERITGSVVISVTNTHGAHAVFPVGATPSWGTHQTSYWSIDDWAPSQVETKYFVLINLTAPSTSGTYSIWFAAGAETTLAHVMSCTHWANSAPLWNDGNDVADWATSQDRCDSTVTPNGVGLRIAVVVRVPPEPEAEPEPEPAKPSSIKVEECVNAVDDEEAVNIEVGGDISGKWEGGCPSITRGGRMARYYTFTLPITTAVEIALGSHLDTYLVLRSGGLSGDILDKDDDSGPGLDSLISRTLMAGQYTIEATTFRADGVKAEFTLLVKAVPRALYDGPISDVAHADYAPDGPTMAVNLLPSLPNGTLEITIADPDGFGAGAGPLGGLQLSDASAGVVIVALPRTVWVHYDRIAVEVKGSSGWTVHAQEDEAGLLPEGGTGTIFDSVNQELQQILSDSEGASQLIESLLALMAATPRPSFDTDLDALDAIFKREYANCVTQVTIPWLVAATGATGIRISMPLSQQEGNTGLSLADDDYASLAVSFVASDNSPALAQLHDLLTTEKESPVCQPPNEEAE